MEDIVPELYKKIKSEFDGLVSSDEEIQAILNGDKVGTFAELYPMSKRVGQYAAKSLSNNYTEELLPDGILYWNIMERTIMPVMKNIHKIDNQLAFNVQKKLDAAQKIGIKPQESDFPEERVNSVMNMLSTLTNDNKTDLQRTSQILSRSVVNISNSIIDNFIQKNAEFRANAGMTAKIIRTSSGHCCEWCNEIAGTYKYPDVPKDVYRRHDNCDCTVEYVCEKVKNLVHSGTEGKRKYVQDEYGNYKLTKEARIAKAKQMAATDEERKKIAREKRIETWKRKNEVKLSKGKDVTSEYEHKKNPGKGIITSDDNYDFSKHYDEVIFAKWLHGYFGGDIRLLNESEEEGVKRADYLWNGKLWDLKSTTTEKAANSAVRKGIKQINDNPGGIILNYNNDIDLQETIHVIEKRIKGSKPEDINFDIMIVKNGKVLIIIRY